MRYRISIFLSLKAILVCDDHQRYHHLKLVEREIGGKVTSLKGRAIDYLSDNVKRQFFPELWEVRNRLTRRAGTSY